MTKANRRLISLTLCLVMTVILCVPAIAADTEGGLHDAHDCAAHESVFSATFSCQGYIASFAGQDSLVAFTGQDFITAFPGQDIRITFAEQDFIGGGIVSVEGCYHHEWIDQPEIIVRNQPTYSNCPVRSGCTLTSYPVLQYQTCLYCKVGTYTIIGYMVVHSICEE